MKHKLDTKKQAADDSGVRIKVRATKHGVYDTLKEPGAVFEITDEDHFSDSWMEEVDEDEKPLPADKQHRMKAARKKRAEKMGVSEKALAAGLEPEQVQPKEEPEEESGAEVRTFSQAQAQKPEQGIESAQNRKVI